ncbi:FadR/GntR family transcriptional regulator [Bacillus sp. 7884-1]|uniref:FadR/GntR family transcriptional regulator n=1 Tax=Bacillus sp. 7884-1 TaxID=2021693 RepID=UPI000BA541FE|nr:GntR family transcriptional regulator [Bacillus sp. 7884-1]
MISADNLKSGDKIPSERELSERLNVGRSSVREALRALELLGLIETRRGEGTFIRDFRGNQLVQLLGTFILQDEKAKLDVIETKNLIEMDFLRLVLNRADENKLFTLKSLVEDDQINDDQFFNQLVEMADNYLFSRIWLILKDYYNSLNLRKVEYNKNSYFMLIEALIEKDEKKTFVAYRQLRNLSILTDKY